jgi:asparagine synthase (glutamine-hydrolysing)
MCGIAGTISFDGDRPVQEGVLRAMCQVQYHRGPDGDGYYLDQHAGLGMRRLSIIDLDTGQQPITNEDRTLWLVFNGEIYNHETLRRRLEQKGHRFASKSDSEVIVHAYEEYGDACVDHFNGMFAFAVWDVREQRLLLARDRLGIKPLYYWMDTSRLVFGSELKALIADPQVPRDIDPLAVDQFLTFEYIPAPRTILEGIRKLPPGHRLVFRQGSSTVERYWDIPFYDTPVDTKDAVAALTELIQDAVRLQLRSDVPLGAFLSGGIDSSTVVAFMSEAVPVPIKTFSIGFEDASYNELPDARCVAAHFQTEHRDEVMRPDIGSLAEQLVGHLDEPLADFSIFPTYLVSKLASQSVKVVLSGDGGDELFGGYDTYVAQRADGFYRWLPRRIRAQSLPALMDRVPPQASKKGLVNKAKRFVEGGALPGSLQHVRWMLAMNEGDKAGLYSPEFRARLRFAPPATSVVEGYFRQVEQREPLAQQQYVDIKTYLADNILTKVDRMSMAASVEARVPLLDHRIVEFALNLPPHLKLHRSQTKVILRQAMARRLPEALRRKPKQGFSIPLKHWLRGPLRPLMADLLSADRTRDRGCFQPARVAEWISEHDAGRANHSHRLWALMVLELWRQRVLDR